jgi:hypothetical protein
MPPMETFSNRSTPFGDMMCRMSATMRVASALLVGAMSVAAGFVAALVNATSVRSTVATSSSHRLKEFMLRPSPLADPVCTACHAALGRNKCTAGAVYDKTVG